MFFDKSEIEKLDTELNLFLYKIDPMSTGCVENLMFDEYELEAIEIIQIINTQLSALQNPEIEDLKDSAGYAVKRVFEEQFSVGCLTQSHWLSIRDEVIKLILQRYF